MKNKAFRFCGRSADGSGVARRRRRAQRYRARWRDNLMDGRASAVAPVVAADGGEMSGRAPDAASECRLRRAAAAAPGAVF